MNELEERLHVYIRHDIEEKAYRRVLKNLLCLSYAYAVRSKITDLFVCGGCEEGQANQLGHSCVMLSYDDRVDLLFDQALTLTNHLEVEKTWRESALQSCIPSGLLHYLMQDRRLRDSTYVIEHYDAKIKKYVKKIALDESRLFI